MKTTAFKGNAGLKRAGVTVEYTVEIVDELRKCGSDFFYFAENYVKIKSLDRGVIPFAMHDFQKKMAEAMIKNRNTAGLAARQLGKCVVGNTKVMFNGTLVPIRSFLWDKLSLRQKIIEKLYDFLLKLWSKP